MRSCHTERAQRGEMASPVPQRFYGILSVENRDRSTWLDRKKGGRAYRPGRTGRGARAQARVLRERYGGGARPRGGDPRLQRGASRASRVYPPQWMLATARTRSPTHGATKQGSTPPSI